jgi:hypothetical protein
MLPVPFALASVIDILLVLAEDIAPHFLPLGGSHITQLGFLFGGAFVVHELLSLAKRILANKRKPTKRGKS